MDRGELLITLLVGVIVMPLLLFLVTLFGSYVRDRQGMAPLPPHVVSLVLMMCIFLIWLITCVSIAYPVLCSLW